MSRRTLRLPNRLALALSLGMFLVALQATTASAQLVYTVTITVQGMPSTSSTSLYVDGTLNGTLSGGASRSFTFSSSPTTHVFTVDFYVPNNPADQVSGGARYYEKDSSWATNAGGSHVFSYSAQFYVSVTTSFGNVKGDGWYDSGTSTQLTLDNGQIAESPGIRHAFTGWGGDASGTGLTSNPIIIDKPKNVVANWKTQFLLGVSSDPQNVTGLAGAGWYDKSSQVNFSAPAISPASANTRLRFDHWSDAYVGQSPTGIVTMDRPKVVVAHYVAQYLLTVHYDPVSIPHSDNGTSWHDANTNVQLGPAQSTIDLSSVERLRFVGWVESGKQLAGISVNLLMDSSHELTLSYMTQYYVDVRSSYDGVSGSGWYDKGATAQISASATAGSWPLTYTLSDWRITPSTGALTPANGSWILIVDRPYVVDAVWSFDLLPLVTLIGASVFVIVAAIGIAVAYRRAMLTRGASVPHPPTPVSKVTGQTQICRNCGTRMPRTATFCQKCGTPVVPLERTALEDKVYDYIVKHEGVISMTKASEDLGLSVEQLKQATEELKKKGRLA
jgi:hypothetical protein